MQIRVCIVLLISHHESVMIAIMTIDRDVVPMASTKTLIRQSAVVGWNAVDTMARVAPSESAGRRAIVPIVELDSEVTEMDRGTDCGYFDGIGRGSVLANDRSSQIGWLQHCHIHILADGKTSI